MYVYMHVHHLWALIRIYIFHGLNTVHISHVKCSCTNVQYLIYIPLYLMITELVLYTCTAHCQKWSITKGRERGREREGGGGESV